MRSVVVALVVLIPVAAHAQVHVDIDVDVHLAPPPPPPQPVVVVVTPPVPQVVVAPPNPNTSPATFGLSLFTSLGTTTSGILAQGFGVTALVHAINGPVEVGIDYERDAYNSSDARVDHRIGYSLYLGPTHGTLTPFVVIPMGVNVVTRPDFDAAVEGFVGIGGGAKLRLGHWLFAADARVLTRSQQTSNDTPQTIDNETVFETRASASILY
jgi:hypothetical protein